MCFPSSGHSGKPIVSFLIASHGRNEVLLQTLARVERCGLARDEFEVLIVCDHPAGPMDRQRQQRRPAEKSDPLARHFPLIHLNLLAEDRIDLGTTATQGKQAKGESPASAPSQHGDPNQPLSRRDALARSRGEYILFLDEDAYPRPGSIGRMVEHFRASPHLAAAVFTITRPDGAAECSPWPGVILPCGTGLRRAALAQVGGWADDASDASDVSNTSNDAPANDALALTFSAQTAAFDLSLRLLATGWDIRPFDDLHITHFHRPGPREARRTLERDVRDGIAFTARYVPGPWASAFRKDWLAYCLLCARTHGGRLAYCTGWLKGWAHALRPGHRRPVSERAIDLLAKLEETERRLRRAQDRYRLKKILLLDYGKCFLTFRAAAERCGIEVVAVADADLGRLGRRAGGLAVLPDERALRLEYDAAVVAQLSPSLAAPRRNAWRHFDRRPVLDLYEDDALAIQVYAPPFRFVGPRGAKSKSSKSPKSLVVPTGRLAEPVKRSVSEAESPAAQTPTTLTSLTTPTTSIATIPGPADADDAVLAAFGIERDDYLPGLASSDRPTISA